MERIGKFLEGAYLVVAVVLSLAWRVTSEYVLPFSAAALGLTAVIAIASHLIGIGLVTGAVAGLITSIVALGSLAIVLAISSLGGGKR